MPTAPDPVASMTRAFIYETVEMAIAYAARRDQIDAYVENNAVLNKWNEAVYAVRREFPRAGGVGFWEDECHNGLVIYSLTLEEGTLCYAGYDPEGDRHSFTLPLDFVFPETREKAIEALRDRYRRKQDLNAEKNAHIAARKRAADEAEFERLGRALGRLPEGGGSTPS